MESTRVTLLRINGIVQREENDFVLTAAADLLSKLSEKNGTKKKGKGN